MKTVGVWLVIVLAAVARSVAAEPPAGTEFSLVVRAQGAELSLKCLLQFAHWITVDSGPIEPGAARVFDLGLAADGTITQENAFGVAMALVRFTCGKVGRWMEIQYSLPLEAIRDAGAPSLLLTCRERGGLECRIASPAP